MFFLVRPVGLKCQLRCGYCYYKDGHEKIRQLSTERMSISNIKLLLDGLSSLEGNHTLCLHGGEPLLIGKEWVAELISLVEAYNRINKEKSSITLTVQTNALLVDEEWVALFKKGHFSVSVSLDGPAKVHNYARAGYHHVNTHSEVISAIDILANNGIRVGCLAVVTSKTLEFGASPFYEYYKSIPLLNGLDVNPYIETGATDIELAAKKIYEPDPKHLTQFVCDLFDLWLFDKDMEKRVDIRMFEQLTSVALDFIPTLCNLTQGAACGRTPSILPNGDVYACDLDIMGLNFFMGSLQSESIAKICSNTRLQSLQEKIKDGLERKGCTKCLFTSYCGLTCPRHIFSLRDHSQYCKLIELLVSHVKKRLNDVSLALCDEPIEFN